MIRTNLYASPKKELYIFKIFNSAKIVTTEFILSLAMSFFFHISFTVSPKINQNNSFFIKIKFLNTFSMCKQLLDKLIYIILILFFTNRNSNSVYLPQSALLYIHRFAIFGIKLFGVLHYFNSWYF